MSAMLRLGMTLPGVIERVTYNPAKAISLTDRAGSLRPGQPADITVFRVNSGNYEISDCYTQLRKAEKEIEPVITFKAGKRFDANMAMGRDESNWFLQIAEDHIPERAGALSATQRAFLNSLASRLSSTTWEVSNAERLDIEKALELQDMFHSERAVHRLPLRDALQAVYASFLDQPFTMQIGLLLVRLERAFALNRLRDVSSKRPLAA